MTRSVNMLWPESATKRDVPAGLRPLPVSQNDRVDSCLLNREPGAVSTNQRLSRQGAASAYRAGSATRTTATVVQRLWRSIFPDRNRRVRRDAVPYAAVAIMFTHRMRNQPAFCPKTGSLVYPCGHAVPDRVSPSRAQDSRAKAKPHRPAQGPIRCGFLPCSAHPGKV
jgi:hypothetical protein